MITVQQAITNVFDGFLNKIESALTVEETDQIRETCWRAAVDLVDLFAWHPIERADEFGLRTPPPGKKWGPRVIVMMNDGPAVAYWDPDQVQPDGTPVAHPSPYWRAVQKQAGWSRRAVVTHFLRPYAVEMENPQCK
jgi:hypothetical protein